MLRTFYLWLYFYCCLSENWQIFIKDGRYNLDKIIILVSN